MKFTILFSVIIISVYTIGCKSEKAKKFSDEIVAKEKTIEADMANTTQKLQNFFISDETDSIVAMSSRMEDEISSIISDIKNTSASGLKEAENFKTETLKYLEYRKNLFETYKNYGLQTTPQGREMERMNMTAMQNQEGVMSHNMEAAQINFARANHVKIK